MEALGQLAGGIAHDFNNVLQAVQGAAGLLVRRSKDPEAVRRLARMAFDAASRGSAITKRLLAFSRRSDLRAEAVDPVALLSDLREILTHTLGAGIGVRVEAPEGLPSLLADKGQLETVLINLATNARDAMSGKGLLTLSAARDVLPKSDGPRPVQDVAAGAYLRLSIIDTGMGMTPEVLAHASEPFFTTKPMGKGTGLGLAMARGFVEQSGGGTAIESQVGRGTTVTLWLPLAEAGSKPDEAGGAAAIVQRGKKARLLVVDDEPLVREIITQQLEAAGHVVVSAGGPQEALVLLDAGEPVDLLVSDLSMPGMDGVALLREAARRRPKLPAILLTGFATNAAELAVGGSVSGRFSLLRKPATEQELTERVAMLLEGADVELD
jgi:CheY-like chemotaxis protein